MHVTKLVSKCDATRSKAVVMQDAACSLLQEDKQRWRSGAGSFSSLTCRLNSSSARKRTPRREQSRSICAQSAAVTTSTHIWMLSEDQTSAACLLVGAKPFFFPCLQSLRCFCTQDLMLCVPAE